MVFSSLVFLFFFLPAVLALYYIVPSKAKNYVLLFFSMFFYAWGGPSYLMLMLAVIIITYLSGIFMARFPDKKKLFLVLGVAGNLSFLGYYKYFNFLMSNAGKLLSKVGIAIPVFEYVVLPVGISFYTFQAISYLGDLYFGTITVQKNPLYLMLYISFFPQLIAGPIVQYRQISEQIDKRYVSSQDFAYGVRRFVMGLGKKILISNEMAWVVDRIFSQPVENISTPLAWIAVIGYAFQIYYDFSGYSDMAIGLGRMFGFRFSENFNYPYLSSSIREFWQRWHISLSSWFREYVYIPLGGNRKGNIRTYMNLFTIFLLTGIWHGASWQYLAWGLYFGIFMVAERLFLGKYLDRHKITGHIYTIFVVLMGWVLFRGNGLSGALFWFGRMFIYNTGSGAVLPSVYLDRRFIFVLLVAIMFCGPVQKLFNLQEKLFDDKKTYAYEIPVIMGIMVLCICLLVGNTYNPFIYFQF
ncbi:MAG: MBOAT family protein [Oscillospiraceae bacterium]|nr:MBOAT family protein [Oscillospiraceae bacterium]